MTSSNDGGRLGDATNTTRGMLDVWARQVAGLPGQVWDDGAVQYQAAEVIRVLTERVGSERVTALLREANERERKQASGPPDNEGGQVVKLVG